MSITLDVNAFLNNNDICTQSGCNGGVGGGGTVCVKNGHMEVDDISMEKEMETNGNIFDEIEHLLKFNKNLEFPEPPKPEGHNKVKKSEEPKPKETFSLDFLTSHTDDFLLASDTQSLLGEDPLLFSVEQDRLQPLSSRFMVPGIYKRIEGVDRIDKSPKVSSTSNVFLTDIEKTGRIISEKEFERLYILERSVTETDQRKVTPIEPLDVNNYPDITSVNDIKENEVQQENTQEVNIPQEWDALHRLAYDIYKMTSRDHIVIDRKRNEIVKTQFKTNQKTIYRLWQPEVLGLKAQESNNINCKDKRLIVNPKNKLRGINKKLKNKETVKKSPKTKKLPENTTKSNETPKKDINSSPIPTSQTRTRSGRLVKIPQISKETIPELLPPSPKDSLTDILIDLKDPSYQCNKVVVNKDEPTETTSLETLPPIEHSPSTPPKRKVPPEAICPTCHKIFLGRRLQKHYAQHPDHIKVPITHLNNDHQLTVNINQPQQQQEIILNNPNEPCNSSGEDMSLFRFLVTKLQKSQQLNEDQKADLFLSELNDLVEQLQLRSSRLIRNTSGLHFVNQRCAKLLSIPEGQYALDLTAIEAPLEPDMHDNSHTNNHTSVSSLTNHLNSRSLDYTNLSITLDDTLTDEAAQKLNLSAGGKLLPPSEESLLRAVDDLVQTDITKIQTTATCVSGSSLPSCSSKPASVVANVLPPHIDHVSDNAVEAVNMKETLPNVVNTSENPLLDLSVDFFQFNS